MGEIYDGLFCDAPAYGHFFLNGEVLEGLWNEGELPQYFVTNGTGRRPESKQPVDT